MVLPQDFGYLHVLAGAEVFGTGGKQGHTRVA